MVDGNGCREIVDSNGWRVHKAPAAGEQTRTHGLRWRKVVATRSGRHGNLYQLEICQRALKHITKRYSTKGGYPPSEPRRRIRLTSTYVSSETDVKHCA